MEECLCRLRQETRKQKNLQERAGTQKTKRHQHRYCEPLEIFCEKCPMKK
nr:MAG TPA: hypothetical protein [Bacteriophage sp.]